MYVTVMLTKDQIANMFGKSYHHTIIFLFLSRKSAIIKADNTTRASQTSGMIMRFQHYSTNIFCFSRKAESVYWCPSGFNIWRWPWSALDFLSLYEYPRRGNNSSSRPRQGWIEMNSAQCFCANNKRHGVIVSLSSKSLQSQKFPFDIQFSQESNLSLFTAIIFSRKWVKNYHH